MSTPDVLPDSRLARRDLAAVMCDWPLPSGGTVRVEVVPVFCASCGTPYGWVPKDNTSFTCWLCRPCFDEYGEIAGTYVTSDEAFNRTLEHEMVSRFGRALTDGELSVLKDRGELGRGLELLERDSPYKTFRG